MARTFGILISCLLMAGCAQPVAPVDGSASRVGEQTAASSETKDTSNEEAPEPSLYIDNLGFSTDEWGTYLDHYVPIFLEAEDIRSRLDEDWPDNVQGLIVENADLAAMGLDEFFAKPLAELKVKSGEYPLARYEAIRDLNQGLVEYIFAVEEVYLAGLAYAVGGGSNGRDRYSEAMISATLYSGLLELQITKIEYSLDWDD